MPIIEIEHQGSTRRLEVGEEFLRLSPADQANAALAAIGAAPSRGQPTPETPDTSFGSALQSGLAGMTQGLGRTARVLGAEDVAQTVEGAGPATPRGYQSAGAALVDNVRNWDVGGALSNLPRAVVEQLPDMGATMAAGATGARIGGASGALVGGPVGAAVGAGVGGLLGAAGYTGLRALGDNAYARAENNGRQEPTTGDTVAAVPGTLAQAALGAVGARGAAIRAPTPSPTAAPVGVTGRLRAATVASGREGATEVVEDLVGQTGQTLGTDRGLDVDPAQALAAGMTGTATRGAISAPAAVARGVPESIAVRAAERLTGDMNPQEAASVVRLAQELDQQIENTRAVTGRPASMDEMLNSVRGRFTADVSVLLREAHRRGWIDDDQRTTLREDVFESAIRHNKTLGDSGDADVRTGLARIDELSAPEPFKAALRDLFRDLDTLSSASRKKNLSGPFERLLDAVGRAGGIAAGAAVGGPYGAAAGVAGALAGNPVGARLGASVGRAIDRLSGTRMPTIVLARQKAQGIVDRAGIDPGNSTKIVGDMRDMLENKRLAERAAAGLDMDPAAVSKDTARLIRRRLTNGVEVTDDLWDLVQTDDLRELQTWANEQDLIREAQEKRRQAAQDAQREARIIAQADEWLAQSAAEANPDPLVVRARNARAFAKVEGKPVDKERAWARVEAQAETRKAAELASMTAARTDPNLAAVTASQEGEWLGLLRSLEARRRAAERTTTVAETPPASPLPPPSAAPIETPTAAPIETPTAAPNRTPRTMPRGWVAGIAGFLRDNYDSRATPIEIEDTIRAEVERGTLSEEVVERFLAQDNVPKDVLQEITRVVFDARQRAEEGETPNGGDRPVRNLHQYRSAASSYQTVAAEARERAFQAGDYAAAELAGEFAVQTETSLPGALRVFRVDALIAASSDPIEKARRKAILNPLVAKYRD